MRSFTSACIALSAVLPVAAMIAPAPVWAAPPIRSLLLRPISPAPSGADGVRIRIYGDKSGGTVQVRLVSAPEDGVLSGFFAATPIVVDFEGWKTITLPLSSFGFGSDTNPDASKDGLSHKESLTSSTSIELAVTGASTRVAVNELAWATGDNATAPLETFDDASLKQWKAVGDYDQIRCVRYGGVTAGELSEGGKPSLQIIVRNYALNERQLNKPAVDIRLKKKIQASYAIYVRNPFEPVYAESVPSIQEIASPASLKVIACPDEIEPASFSVYTLADIKNATVRIAGSFASVSGGSISADAVDVRVVRVGTGYPAPQVLMKDDREALTGALASVRLTGEPTTDIAAETSKQFWVSVHVPSNATPGTYQGKLVFSGTGIKPTVIPVSIEVPDLTLKTAFLQYGIELRSHTIASGETPGVEAIPLEAYASQLADIKAHGFRLVEIFQTPTNLENDIRLYKEANMSLVGPVVVSINDGGDVATVENIKHNVGLSSDFDIFYYLGPDIVNGGNVRTFGQAITSANHNALVSAVVESSDVYAALRDALNDPTGERLAPIYPISSDYAQKVIAESKRSTPNRDYWRWSLADQSPSRNRILSGMMLYRTGPGFYGAFPGPYQRVPAGMSPYAALDPNADPNAPHPTMTTYPVQGGVLDTVQWEATRAGVDDIRYIGALKANIRELKDAKKAKEATDAAESRLAALTDRPILTLTPAQHQAARMEILQVAVELKYILDPSARRVAPAKVAAPKPPAKSVKKHS
jgi:hypothetical protein